MSKKNKKKDELDLEDISNEDTYDDFEEPKSSKELKKEAKERAKEEKAEELAATDEILNSKSKNKVEQNFKMYKFIIKIIVCAILLAFGCVLIFFQAEMVGAVYLVSGISILLAALIRLIPVLKTSKSKRARLILFIQCMIHLVIGAYLIIAAVVHWNVLKQLVADGTSSQEVLKTLSQVVDNKFLNDKFNVSFAAFNTVLYLYLMVIFFFTLSAGYFWVTIEYKEPTSKTLFWLMMIANTVAVAIALAAKYINAISLVYALIVLVFLGALVVGGEAGGGYYRYRKALTSTKAKKERKSKDKDDEIRTPAREEEVDYTDIDPSTIPQNDPQDDANIVS